MTDFLQVRYGYSDKYLFEEIAAERFVLMVREVTETAVKEAESKYKQDMRNHAFQAFLQGAGGEMDYESFLIHLGLHEDAQAQQDITAEEALEKGKNIMKMLG